jgi:hypothetical protein
MVVLMAAVVLGTGCTPAACPSLTGCIGIIFQNSTDGVDGCANADGYLYPGYNMDPRDSCCILNSINCIETSQQQCGRPF